MQVTSTVIADPPGGRGKARTSSVAREVEPPLTSVAFKSNLTAVIAWFILNLDHAPTLSGSGHARSFTLNLLRFANRVGHEDGIAFWGGSEVVAPDGTVVARAPDFEEHLLVAEVDPDLVARERDRNPLIRDERADLVVSHLARARGFAD